VNYWNKDKKKRLSWISVPPPDIASVKLAKRWCQQQESTGKFYHHYTNTRWWFENEQDASLFLLFWAGKKS